MEIGTISQYYPESVRDLVNETIEVAIKSGASEGINTQILEEEFCIAGLQKFISGGDEMAWSEDEFIDVISRSNARTRIERLIELGYIDSIEDEDGKEIIFPTKKGIEIIELLKSTYDYISID